MRVIFCDFRNAAAQNISAALLECEKVAGNKGKMLINLLVLGLFRIPAFSMKERASHPINCHRFTRHKQPLHPLTTAPIFAKIIRDNVVRKRSMQQAPTERDTHRLEGVLARQWQKVASKQRF